MPTSGSSFVIAGDLAAGRHVAGWDGIDATGLKVASGTYLLRLQSGTQVQRQKVVLLE